MKILPKRTRLFYGVILILITVIITCSSTFAVQPGESIPNIILTGLKIYKGNPGAAMQVWLKGSPLAGTEIAREQEKVLKETQNRYGRFLGYDLIEIAKLSESSQLVYIQMNFQDGPLFCKFLCYLKYENWIISGTLLFHPDPEEVIPDRIMFR
ncbi:MAG: hypothetical protein D8M57_04180 [Candidatus Scalindua sp. AMX11]|nr:MAG: hypothetical protein DWQ00_10515 [Candidatus Scalindua sp.]NOG82639.1 hypothetical protein [Planctomycetota bacterium]RZV95215.1 MAG: hypothetical protein EX341_02455 [Candidatus Scalindua sp. SCAELEC01]TDE66306.1 MAG: hypothetical protein D8M57_04180 [Candidatus Scalindua sp. AMX11]GJQ57931.1 MAG: hypothetical protein SCALA701_07320 [Candidatus Scalindua sp.]